MRLPDNPRFNLPPDVPRFTLTFTAPEIALIYSGLGVAKQLMGDVGWEGKGLAAIMRRLETETTVIDLSQPAPEEL